MASDLIYREDAKVFVRHACYKKINPIDYLDEVPAADVRVVRGAWKPNPRNPYWLDCTVCGYGKPEKTVYNFCPNCGADMRGDKNGQIGEKDNG